MINNLPLLVAAAFKNAEENGYFFEGYTDSDIANDMITCDADIAEYPFEQVLKYIRIQRIADK